MVREACSVISPSPPITEKPERNFQLIEQITEGGKAMVRRHRQQ